MQKIVHVLVSVARFEYFHNHFKVARNTVFSRLTTWNSS